MPREVKPIVVIRKRAAAPHAHHGGAWKVAYADFVTAMMALFMVMWLLASSDPKSRKEIANYFRTGILPDGDMSMDHAAQVQPSVIEESSAPPPPAGRGTLVREQTRQLRAAIDAMAKIDPEIAKIASQVTVSATPDGALIEAIDKDGKDAMLFDVSSSDLKPALVDFLTRLAPVLAGLDGTTEINGHTDSRPFVGSDARDNWSLSFERADAARRILERAGLAESRVGGVIGRADSQLHDPQDAFAAENRRLGLLVRPPPEPAAPSPSAPGASP